MSFAIALRNLGRNRWRSGLTLCGVAVGVALLIWSEAMTEGFLGTMVRSVTGMQLGDLRVETAEHAERPTIYDAFPVDTQLLERIERAQGVVAATPRLQSFALLACGARSEVAAVVGVDPEREGRVSEVPRSVRQGRWLSNTEPAAQAPREIVLGDVLARMLSAEVGSEIVVLLQAADGSLGDDRLRVVGIARTGSTELDRQTAWMTLPDLAYLAALEGRAHVVVTRLHRTADLQRSAAAVRKIVRARHGSALIVRTWEQILPDVRQMVDLSRWSMGALYLLICFVAALGILNAQRMSALERKREFGVMLAMGVTPGQLGRLVVMETAMLSLLGALAGGGLGWAISAWHAHAGLDLTVFGSSGFTYQGVSFGSRVYFIVTPSLVLLPVLAAVAVGSLCGVWPAVASARINIVRAIAGRS